MKPIEVGIDAPAFMLKDINNNNISLSDFKGQRILMSWHPLAWTPVCTDQMRSLENNWQTFQKFNCVPLGLSVDAPPCKKAWATAINIDNVSLPSDFWPHGKVAQEYGLFNEKQGISERANILIDEYGKIIWIKNYYTQQLPDINEVIQVLSNL